MRTNAITEKLEASLRYEALKKEIALGEKTLQRKRDILRSMVKTIGFSEAEMLPKENAFAVLPLDRYRAKDLECLLDAVMLSHSTFVMSSHERNSLDVWTYRIRDAWKEARRRES